MIVFHKLTITQPLIASLYIYNYKYCSGLPKLYLWKVGEIREIENLYNMMKTRRPK